MDESPLDINIRNSYYWIRETIRNERFHRRGCEKTLSLVRVARMLAPNLARPIFAIGAPRSGTTFLGQCLFELPEISYHHEPSVTKAAVRYIYDGEWSDTKAKFLYRTTYAWLMRASVETDRRFCEKTPGNCFILPFLHRSFTGAKFIHILRDGRDAALSLSKKTWYTNVARQSGDRDPDGYLFGPSKRFWVESDRIDEYESTNDLHRCIWLWRRYVECALEGARSLPTNLYYQLRYEDLLENPANYADRIVDFLEIDDNSSRTLFRDNVIASARADSVGLWKKQIRDEQHQQLLNEAAPLLQKLGYEI